MRVAAVEDRRLQVVRLGEIDYLEAWELQRRAVAARHEGRLPDTLLLLEHPHTYTRGRASKEEHILLTRRQLARRKIAVYDVDRGGDVTYHGPGQLVGYLILQLESGRFNYIRYIRDLERSLLHAVQDLGVPAGLHDGLSGVWVGNEKLCAIGVKIDAQGITSHGFALNVNPDLSYFGHIIPCGITDKGVTSLDRLPGCRVSMDRVAKAVTRRLAEAFDLQPTPRSMGRASLEKLLG